MGWLTLSPWKPVPGKGQNVTIDATLRSTATALKGQAVRLQASGNCHVQIVDPTTPPANAAALAAETLILATDDAQIFGCSPGDKVYVVQDAASTGTLNVQELTH